MKYNRGLMMAILHDRIRIARAVNVELIPLEQAPEAYQSFDSGVPKKFVIDPHHMVRTEARPPRTDRNGHGRKGESLMLRESGA
jgi:glutathione-independent formaldehyde dehydrogenase